MQTNRPYFSGDSNELGKHMLNGGRWTAKMITKTIINMKIEIAGEVYEQTVHQM
jgi:hypothetical protein